MCVCVCGVCARVCLGERKGVKEKGEGWGGSERLRILDRVSI